MIFDIGNPLWRQIKVGEETRAANGRNTAQNSFRQKRKLAHETEHFRMIASGIAGSRSPKSIMRFLSPSPALSSPFPCVGFNLRQSLPSRRPTADPDSHPTCLVIWAERKALSWQQVQGLTLSVSRTHPWTAHSHEGHRVPWLARSVRCQPWGGSQPP